MKNINKKIPTIEELREKVEKEKLEFNADIEFDELGTQIVLSLLQKNKDFYNYLTHIGFSDFDLTTVVFSKIQYYALEKIERNQIEELTKIFNYLEKLLSEGNSEIKNLIQIGLLENIPRDRFNKMKPYMKELLINQYNNLVLFCGE